MFSKASAGPQMLLRGGAIGVADISHLRSFSRRAVSRPAHLFEQIGVCHE
jgi:hypothetical protein